MVIYLYYQCLYSTIDLRKIDSEGIVQALSVGHYEKPYW